jgi:aminoglycoside phosphotransferase (APT) family kinase protein
MPKEYLQMAFDKIKNQLGATLAIGEQIATNGKTVVMSGRLDGAPIVIKSLVTDNDFYSASFRHEVQLYQTFFAHKPPFDIPKIYLVTEDPPSIVFQRLDGNVLSDDRFPRADELSWERVEKIYDMLLSLRQYDVAVSDDRAGVLKRYNERWDKYIQHGIYTPEDKAILQRLESTPGWRCEFNHGDPVPRNIIVAHDKPSLIDWEFGGSYVPFYDVAVLWAVLSRQPELQQALEMNIRAFPLHDQVCFAANTLNIYEDRERFRISKICNLDSLQHPPTKISKIHHLYFGLGVFLV